MQIFRYVLSSFLFEQAIINKIHKVSIGEF